MWDFRRPLTATGEPSAGGGVLEFKPRHQRERGATCSTLLAAELGELKAQCEDVSPELRANTPSDGRVAEIKDRVGRSRKVKVRETETPAH